MHVGFNVAVEIWRDVVRFVRSFNFLDPNVKETQLLINQTFESIRFLEHVVDTAHQERKETQANELPKVLRYYHTYLKNHTEYLFISSAPSVITISDSRESLQYEVQGEDIDRLEIIFRKALISFSAALIFVDPRRFHCIIVIKSSEKAPKTAKEVRGKEYEQE